MKKRLVSFLCLAALLCCAAPFPQANAASAATQIEILWEYFDLWNTFAYSDAVYLYYDMDGDGLDEMLVRSGRSEADFDYAVYSYKNGFLQYADHFGGGHSDLFAPPGEDRLLLQYAHMGSEEIYELTLSGGTVRKNRILSRTVKSADDYTQLSGYIAPYDAASYHVPALNNLQKAYIREVMCRLTSDDISAAACDFDNDGLAELIIIEKTWQGTNVSYTYRILKYENGAMAQSAAIKRTTAEDDRPILLNSNSGNALLWYGGGKAQRWELGNQTVHSSALPLTGEDPLWAFYLQGESLSEIFPYQLSYLSDAELRDEVSAGTPYGPGDPSGDGKVTATDARLALRQAVGLEHFAADSKAFRACEVTGDGKVTAADARKILRAAVGLERL